MRWCLLLAAAVFRNIRLTVCFTMQFQSDLQFCSISIGVEDASVVL